jgi:hypothetical protein
MVASSLYNGSTFALVFATVTVVAGFFVLRASLRRAGQVTTIRLAAPIPQARALALPSAPTASAEPEPSVPPNV